MAAAARDTLLARILDDDDKHGDAPSFDDVSRQQHDGAAAPQDDEGDATLLSFEEQIGAYIDGILPPDDEIKPVNDRPCVECEGTNLYCFL